MKKARKILTMALCAVLLVCLSVGATYAYLTAGTGEVKNTFTVGNVQIDLDEQKVTEYGIADGTTRQKENTYKLIPAHTYIKDPTVHVKKGSEQCYVFVKVEDGIAAIQDATTVADQMTANGWQPLVVDGATVKNVYFYGMTNKTNGDIVDARNAAADIDLLVFANFKLKANADVATYDGETITVDAYAVQADGFASAAAAWAAAVPTWESATQG